MFEPYLAKVPRVEAVRWTPDVQHPAVVEVNNGYDQAYAYVKSPYMAMGSGHEMTGEIGDYLVHNPTSDTYYFVPAREFDKLFVKE